jgi:methionine sulfoxide reductase heme-binding subunit
MTLWYLARAAGAMALACFTLTVVLGALAPTVARAGMRFGLGYVHRAAAVTGLVLIAGHLTAVITDSYVNIGPSVVLWPLGSSYRPFAVLLGALALYAFVFAAVLGAVRGRLATSEAFSRRWRVLHGIAYLGWGLSITHGLLAGTDRGSVWMLWLDLGCLAAVAFAVTIRLQADADHRRRPLTIARTRARAQTLKSQTLKSQTLKSQTLGSQTLGSQTLGSRR